MAYSSQVDIIAKLKWPTIANEYTIEYPYEPFIEKIRTDIILAPENLILFEPQNSLVDYSLFIFDKLPDFLKNKDQIKRENLPNFLKNKAKIKKTDSFPLITTCNQLLRLGHSSRLLIIQGYEDTARIILRTFMETAEVLLLMIFDEKTFEEYNKYLFTSDSNQFWYNNIKGGKAESLLKEYYDKIHAKEWGKAFDKPDRLGLKQFLGDYAHASPDSGTIATICPSLNQPGMFEGTKFKRYSTSSLYFLRQITDVANEFSYMLISGIVSEVYGKHINSTYLPESIMDLFIIHQNVSSLVEYYSEHITKINESITNTDKK